MGTVLASNLLFERQILRQPTPKPIWVLPGQSDVLMLAHLHMTASTHAAFML